jgi:hypothetical protein
MAESKKNNANHYKNGLLRATGEYPKSAAEEEDVKLITGISEKQLSKAKLAAIIDAYGRHGK